MFVIAVVIKDELSGLGQFLATERPLKLIKDAFYSTLKALFVLKIFKVLSWIFAHVEKIMTILKLTLGF